MPFRPKRSAAAYAEVWDAERGSPLMFHSQDLAAAVQDALGQGWKVQLAMRYGDPAIGPALAALDEAGVERIVVLPLYPQYALSSTASTLEKVYAEATAGAAIPSLSTVPDFYDDPGFLDAVAEVTRPHLAELFGAPGPTSEADHVLFSFHGLPERQVQKTDRSGSHCLASATCCDRIVSANRSCYRAQSYATARLLAQRLELPDGRWSVSFQSRLGRTPWIKPYTDEVLPQLVQRGVRRLAIASPSFVSDCLETLEELAIRAKADFLDAGGEAFVAVPCVNSSPAFVRAVVDIARGAVGPPSKGA